MNSFPAFVAAVALMLAMPGPTNALLTASGATVGLRRSLGLIPAEIAGYLVTIGALMLAGGPLVTAAPVLGTAVRMLLAGYLAYLAWRLRRVGVPAAARNDAPVVRKDVFLTTWLNP